MKLFLFVYTKNLIINSFQALFLLLTLGTVYKNICHELPSLTCVWKAKKNEVKTQPDQKSLVFS